MLLGWSVNDLPQGWALTTLAEITDFNPKLQLDDSLEVGFVPMSHAPTNFRDKLRFDPRPWAEVRKAYTHFADGDVIFAKVTPCFENGKAAIVSALPNGSGAGSSEFHVLRPASIDISSTYLLALVKSSSFMREGEAAMTGAVGLRRVPRGFVENFPVVLPPASEQARIAQALEGLLAQVDTLKARLDALPALIKRFRQSVLSAGIAGRLTEDWRSSHPETFAVSIEDIELRIKSSGFVSKSKGLGIIRPNAIPGWLDAQLGSLISVKSGDGLTAKEMKVDGDIPVYGGNGINGHHSDSNVARPTIVIGRVGYYCGSVHFTPDRAWITDNALIVNYPSTILDIRYVFWLLLGTNLRENTSSSAQPVISGEKIYPIHLSIAPFTEQLEIVRRVEQLFSFADQLEARLADARQRVDALTQSILAKAFRGELVSQDPNDEPASVLLERIAAQRAAEPKPKRSRKAAAH